MKPLKLITIFIVSQIQIINAQYNSNLQIDYFGQTPPGDKAVVFAPDFISRKDWYVQNACFSHDGKEFVFVKTDSAWTRYSLMYTHIDKNGKWTEPTELFPDENVPFFSYNDSILYFSHSEVDLHNKGNIYISRKTVSGWAKPEKLSYPINSDDGDEWEISESKNGTLYFSSTRQGARGIDLYTSKLENGKYINAENLGETINSNSTDECPYIAPDESFLIFNSWRYNPKFLGNNLYISYRNNDGTWSDIKDLGESINTDDLDIYPYITPDGKYFIFTRHSFLGKNTYSKIFWISTSFLDEVKKSKDSVFKSLTLSTEDLDQYPGSYSIPQSPDKIEVLRDNSTLLVKFKNQPIILLDAIEKDVFIQGAYIFKFVPEKQELIISIHGGKEIGRFTKEKQ
jgi:hypothetical protein